MTTNQLNLVLQALNEVIDTRINNNLATDKLQEIHKIVRIAKNKSLKMPSSSTKSKKLIQYTSNKNIFN